MDHSYGTIIKHIYESVTACVRLHEETTDFIIKKGVRVRQWGVIHKKLNLDHKGININNKRLHDLRFPNHILLIADSICDTKEMFEMLYTSLEEVRLKINT